MIAVTVVRIQDTVVHAYKLTPEGFLLFFLFFFSLFFVGNDLEGGVPGETHIDILQSPWKKKGSYIKTFSGEH